MIVTKGTFSNATVLNKFSVLTADTNKGLLFSVTLIGSSKNCLVVVKSA